MHTIVFTDLDGTLLEHDGYSFDAARPALDRMAREGVPLVLCTSKTRGEIEPLRRALSNEHPFVSENGGAAFIPRGYFPFEVEGAVTIGGYDALVWGASYDEVTSALQRASQASGVAVRGFSRMTDGEVAQATGLSLHEARLARQRDFDEPFEIADEAAGTAATHGDRAAPLLAAIEREGMRWTAGGRFYHAMGASDKGSAVRALSALYRRQREGAPVTTVGLGDAPNDASFLREVDIPYVIDSPRADALLALVPHARLTSRPGPAGWNDAVLSALDASRRDGVAASLTPPPSPSPPPRRG